MAQRGPSKSASGGSINRQHFAVFLCAFLLAVLGVPASAMPITWVFDLGPRLGSPGGTLEITDGHLLLQFNSNDVRTDGLGTDCYLKSWWVSDFNLRVDGVRYPESTLPGSGNQLAVGTVGLQQCRLSDGTNYDQLNFDLFLDAGQRFTWDLNDFQAFGALPTLFGTYPYTGIPRPLGDMDRYTYDNQVSGVESDLLSRFALGRVERWVGTAPEPSTVWLLSVSVLAFFGMRTRRTLISLLRRAQLGVASEHQLGN